MNPDNPMNPREALEPSLTALLLGELPEDQAQLVRRAIASDPELAKVFERLKSTTVLLRETEAPPVKNPTSIPAKLNARRREELLQKFKTIQPPVFQQPRRLTFSAAAVLAACVVLSAVLVIALLPALSRRETEPLVQLRQTDAAFRRKYAHFGEYTAPVSTDANSVGDTVKAGSSRLYVEQPPGAAPAQTTAGSPIGQAIVLPAEGKAPQSWTLADNAAGNQAVNLQYDTQPQASLAPPAEVSQDLAGSFTTYSGGSAGLGGGLGVPPNSGPVPLLGDEPLLGRAFRADNSTFQDGLDKNDLALKRRILNESTIAAGKPVQAPALNRVENEKLAELTAPSEPPQKTELRPDNYFGYLADGEKKSKGALVEEIDQLKDLTRVEVPALRSELRADGLASNQELDAAGQRDAKKVETRERASVFTKRFALNKEQDEDRSKQAAAAGRVAQSDLAAAKPAIQALVPQPEVATKDNAFSTFSLNVSDVSFRLAAAALEQGKLPEPASIRSEEFINAFEYRDPEPAPGQAIAFAWDRARSPFAQNRDLLRFSIKTAASGRAAGQSLNLVLLLDNSGSMERADRVRIIHEALRVLASQLQAGDTLSVVTFARTARLWVDGVSGDQAGRIADELSGLTPEGGTNLEEAMNLAYQTATRHYHANGVNRVVLLTDGAANLGDTNPEVLKQKVEANRKQGVAFDCFGVGWEGYNDDLLEVLTRNGDGRYGFLNTPDEAANEFAAQLAGALRIAAADVKVQVEFNPNRVTSFRQIGYARHQLAKEQFRDNTVDAAEIGAAEAGNGLYAIETNPEGSGPIATVRTRYKTPGTTDYHEHEWTVPYDAKAVGFEQASPALRLAGTAAAFSEWLAASPYGAEINPDRLLPYLNDLPSVYGADPRPQKLSWMIRQAKTLSGK